MNLSRIAVRHWIVAKTVRTYGTDPPEADLLGVTLAYPVPADTEFPGERRYVCLYLSYTAHNAGTTSFLIQAHYERRSDEWKLVMQLGDDGRPINLPDDQSVDRVEVFRVPYIRLPGPGLYAVSIFFRSTDDAPTDDEPTEEPFPTPWDPAESGWVFGAVDYFLVPRP